MTATAARIAAAIALLLAAGAEPRAAVPGAPGAAGPGEDLAEIQVRAQETLADAREQRVRGAARQLDAREQAALDGRNRLADRERELTVREQQLDARERLVSVRGPQAPQQRQLESREAQLAARERTLAAQERSDLAALDAARGRDRDAMGREDAERLEASRLGEAASGAGSGAAQLELRRQATAARNRQLAASEARLVARGQIVDVLERQLRARTERLDVTSRRLDARAERVEALEKRAPSAEKQPAAARAKEKTGFVLVVKSPTAISTEAAVPAASAAPALHPVSAAEKTVAAATVVMFATPAARLSELDVEALSNVAKVAARERCELLVWARAEDPSQMAEAQRRAAEIQARVGAAAALAPGQVVVRITTRPGAKGVDVVVSALRDASAAAAAPEAHEAPKLLAGESGNRQIREALRVAQPSIEACVGELDEAKRLARADSVLRLTVSAPGRVTRVASAGDLSGTQLEDCLAAAARDWTFPSADREYVVDVPITLLRAAPR